MTENIKMNHYDLLNAQCINYQVRKLSRMMATYFDKVMLPRAGLRYTQFTMLVGIASYEGRHMTRFAREMHIDRTTISRNLEPLIKRGLIEYTLLDDKRSKAIRLTARGALVLEEAIPVWQTVTDELIAKLGAGQYDTVNALLKTFIAKLGT